MTPLIEDFPANVISLIIDYLSLEKKIVEENGFWDFSHATVNKHVNVGV